MTTIIRTVLVLAGLAGTLLITPALAQESRGVLEEIIVTAERREALLQEVPIAVTAMSMDQLIDLQVWEGRDLQRYVPSLNMFGNVTHPSNLSLSLRGGLQQDASLVVAESPVGIYVDDIYVARLNGNNLTLLDMERVEVLRGPQGTLYGRNTGYGAIKYVSRTPGEEFWADAAAGAGNDDQLLFRGSVGGPLGDNWAASGSFQWREKDGQYFNFHPSANSETGKEENLSVRGKLRWMPSDRFDAVLSVLYSDSENDSNQMPTGRTPSIPATCQDLVGDPMGTCPPGVVTTFSQSDLVYDQGDRGTFTPWDPGRLPAPPLPPAPEAKTEQTIVGLTIDYDITDTMTFKSITGYVGFEGNFMTDFGNGPIGALGGSESDGDQFTQEFQLLGTAFDDRLNYIAGFYYLTEEADQLWGWNIGVLPPPPGPPLITLPSPGLPVSQSTIDVETDSYSFFGELGYNFTDAFRLIAGLRYTEDDKDFELIFPFPSAFGGPADVITDSQTSDAWTPRVVLEYSFAGGALDSGLVYASYAEGFKGAGWSAISIGFAVGERYDDELNTTYEVGFKGEWLDNRLRTNLAYYFSDIEDVAQNATVVTPLGGSFPVQTSGDMELQSLEFEITAVPVDGLNLFFSGTAFTDGEFKNLIPTSAAAQAPFLFGIPEPLTPQTPDYTYNIGFSYTFDMPGNFMGDFSFGADYYEMDDYVTAATNDFTNEGWDIWNAYIAADFGEKWNLTLQGRNLADDVIVTSGSRGLGGFVLLPPREYLVILNYKY